MHAKDFTEVQALPQPGFRRHAPVLFAGFGKIDGVPDLGQSRRDGDHAGMGADKIVDMHGNGLRCRLLRLKGIFAQIVGHHILDI